MLITEGLLLLSMASLPWPAGASPHPIHSGTLVAQADGWRGNPPPPPAFEEPVGRRRPGFVWVEGGYDWRRGRYIRHRGHWERAPAGRQWHGGHWEWQGDHYAWVRGIWIDGPAYVAPPSMIVQNPPPPPPPPQAPPPPPQPRPGFVWIAGSHEWRDGQYVWLEGHWEQDRSGDAWRAGHWDRDGDRQAWHPGGWEHGDHGGDHGDHDHDHGDHGGGDWHGQPPGQGQGYGARVAISISGQVVDQMGRPAAGITIVLAGTSEGRTVTDGAGRYIFMGLTPGSYAVRPNEPRCGFRPDVMNFNNLGANAIQNFGANCR